MPRTTQEIIDNADELAKKFEDYEPEDGDFHDSPEWLILQAVRHRTAAEQELLDAVEMARRQRMTWKRIGEFLGTTSSAAQQKYGPLIDA